MDKKRKQEIREFAGGWAVVNMVPRVSDITRELLDALDAAEARAIELETQLIPLQQQFDDWAEQNRRAKAWAAAWKRKAKMLREWYFYAEKHIFRSQELSQRVNELEATNARLRAALEVVLDQVDYTADNCGLTEMVGAVLPKVAIRLAREALEGAP